MSFSLECAVMMQALIDLNPTSSMVESLRVVRDQCLADVPAEMERERTAMTWLSGKMERTFDGGQQIEIPISYE